MSLPEELRNKRARENISELQQRSEGTDRTIRDLKRRVDAIAEDIKGILADVADLVDRVTKLEADR